ncbi:MAG: hypothetical protein H3C38_04545 [Rhodospirillales bacterium]|nr:hypothetical protein [Rhodospirillales bacterium]
MKLKDLDDVRGVAEVHTDLGRLPQLSRRERLERWADVLDGQRERTLRSLLGTEFVPPRERKEMRVDDSPFTVAFEDPILRAEGLRSDKLGDAVAFFGLSDHDAHRLVCDCYRGRTMTARSVAADVRTIAWYSAVDDLLTPRTVVAGVSAVAAAMLVLSII